MPNLVHMQAEEQERQKAKDAWIDRLSAAEPETSSSTVVQQKSDPVMSPTQHRPQAAMPERLQHDASFANESSMSYLQHQELPGTGTMGTRALPDRRSTRDALQGMQYSAQPDYPPVDTGIVSPGRLAAMQPSAGESYQPLSSSQINPSICNSGGIL